MVVLTVTSLIDRLHAPTEMGYCSTIDCNG